MNKDDLRKREDQKSIVKETLEWLKERKTRLERDIATSLHEIVTEFKEQTGVSVTSVYLTIQMFEEIGREPRFEITRADVDLDL